MDFITAVKTVLIEKYATFTGRARRSEYWWYTLATVLVSLILGLINVKILSGLVNIALLIPGIAVSMRRLHDIGKCGWWLLLGFIPLVNLYLIYLFVKDSQPGENEYGASPKA